MTAMEVWAAQCAQLRTIDRDDPIPTGLPPGHPLTIRMDDGTREKTGRFKLYGIRFVLTTLGDGQSYWNVDERDVELARDHMRRARYPISPYSAAILRRKKRYRPPKWKSHNRPPEPSVMEQFHSHQPATFKRLYSPAGRFKEQDGKRYDFVFVALLEVPDHPINFGMQQLVDCCQGWCFPQREERRTTWVQIGYPLPSGPFRGSSEYLD